MPPQSYAGRASTDSGQALERGQALDRRMPPQTYAGRASTDTAQPIHRRTAIDGAPGMRGQVPRPSSSEVPPPAPDPKYSHKCLCDLLCIHRNAINPLLSFISRTSWSSHKQASDRSLMHRPAMCRRSGSLRGVCRGRAKLTRHPRAWGRSFSEGGRAWPETCHRAGSSP